MKNDVKSAAGQARAVNIEQNSDRDGLPCAPAPTGEQIRIVHGDQVATIVAVGGGLRTYQLGEREILDGYGRDRLCSDARGQALIPWPNRLMDGMYRFGGEDQQLPLTEPEKGNAIHGLVRFANWTVAARTGHGVTLTHTLHPSPGYPFALALSIEYSLSDAGLSVATTATNIGTDSCPYGAGAHPYITAGTEILDPAWLTVPATSWLPTDERGIPTSVSSVHGTPQDFSEPRPIAATQLDTGYTDLIRDPDGLARVVLRAPEADQAVAVWLDESYPYVMAFTGDSLPEPSRRRRGLGVEPMTCAPNAFRTGDGLRVLEPGDSFSSAWGIEPELRIGR
ncbi:MAG: aldose 1-epimerase family protein [Solirubrobacteraceae bacterium]